MKKEKKSSTSQQLQQKSKCFLENLLLDRGENGSFKRMKTEKNIGLLLLLHGERKIPFKKTRKKTTEEKRNQIDMYFIFVLHSLLS